MVLRGEVRSAEALGRMLQQARLVRGKTQRQLAEEIGTDQKYIWGMEAGPGSIVNQRLFEFLQSICAHMFMEIDEDADGIAESGANHG